MKYLFLNVFHLENTFVKNFPVLPAEGLMGFHQQRVREGSSRLSIVKAWRTKRLAAALH
jgi:hypothetical protein